jgi:hypothetical protein
MMMKSEPLSSLGSKSNATYSLEYPSDCVVRHVSEKVFAGALVDILLASMLSNVLLTSRS